MKYKQKNYLKIFFYYNNSNELIWGQIPDDQFRKDEEYSEYKRSTEGVLSSTIKLDGSPTIAFVPFVNYHKSIVCFVEQSFSEDNTFRLNPKFYQFDDKRLSASKIEIKESYELTAIRNYENDYKVLAIDGVYSPKTDPTHGEGILFLLQNPKTPKIVYWCWTLESEYSGTVSIILIVLILNLFLFFFNLVYFRK